MEKSITTNDNKHNIRAVCAGARGIGADPRGSADAAAEVLLSGSRSIRAPPTLTRTAFHHPPTYLMYCFVHVPFALFTTKC